MARTSWNVRLLPDEKAVIVRAAALAQRTTSDFVRLAAIAKARQLIERSQRKPGARQ